MCIKKVTSGTTSVTFSTDEEPRSNKIKNRRLKWLGRLMRLPRLTPAHKALEEALRPVKRPIERPKATWISQINEELKEIQPDLQLGTNTLINLTNNSGDTWRTAVVRRASGVPTNRGNAL